MNEHYAAVIADLRHRRAALEAEMRELDAAIVSIQRLGDTHLVRGVGVSLQPSPDMHTEEHQRPPAGRFGNISVRWGVLWFLAEYANGFTKTGEIAAALLEGGYKTEAVRFQNMVSAVLSTMKAKGEVETNEEGGYQLTEQGRTTWTGIRQGAKFRYATSPNEHSLLSVQ